MNCARAAARPVAHLGAEVGERRCAGSEQDERRAVGRAGARSGEAGEVVRKKG